MNNKLLFLALLALIFARTTQAMNSPQKSTIGAPQRAQLIRPAALQSKAGSFTTRPAITNNTQTKQRIAPTNTASSLRLPANAMPSPKAGMALKPTTINKPSLQQSIVKNPVVVKPATSAVAVRQPVTRESLAQKGRAIMAQSKAVNVPATSSSVAPKAAAAQLATSQPSSAISTASKVATGPVVGSTSTSTGSSMVSSLQSNLGSQLNTASQSLTSKIGSAGSGSSVSSDSSSTSIAPVQAPAVTPAAAVSSTPTVTVPAEKTNVTSQLNTSITTPSVVAPVATQTVATPAVAAPKKPLVPIDSSAPVMLQNTMQAPVMPKDATTENVIQYMNDKNRYEEEKSRIDAQNQMALEKNQAEQKARINASTVADMPQDFKPKQENFGSATLGQATSPYLTEEDKYKFTNK